MDKKQASQELINAFNILTGPNVRGWSAQEYEQAKKSISTVLDFLAAPEQTKQE